VVVVFVLLVKRVFSHKLTTTVIYDCYTVS
jgi:hypothetical protein